LFVLLLLDRVRLALQPLPALERVMFLLTMGTGFGLAFRYSRPVRLAGLAPRARHAANLAMLGVALALLAEIGGWTYLAYSGITSKFAANAGYPP
jgi:hypothetical protein